MNKSVYKKILFLTVSLVMLFSWNKSSIKNSKFFIPDTKEMNIKKEVNI